MFQNKKDYVLLVLKDGLPLSHALVQVPEGLEDDFKREIRNTLPEVLQTKVAIHLVAPAPTGLPVIVTEDGAILTADASFKSTPCLVAGTFHKDAKGTAFLVQKAKQVGDVWSLQIESGQMKG